MFVHIYKASSKQPHGSVGMAVMRKVCSLQNITGKYSPLPSAIKSLNILRRTGGGSQLVGKKMEVRCTGERVVVVLTSATLSPRSVRGELQIGRVKGKDHMSCLAVPLHMFIAMKDEKDEFCVFRLVVRRPQ